MPLDLGLLLFKTGPELTMIVFTIKLFSSVNLKSFLALLIADLRSFAIGWAGFFIFNFFSSVILKCFLELFIEVLKIFAIGWAVFLARKSAHPIAKLLKSA